MPKSNNYPFAYGLDPAFVADLRRLWKRLKTIVDPTDHWRAGPAGEGPFRQNTNANPRPICLKTSGLRVARTFTFGAFVQHVMTHQAVLLVNRDGTSTFLVRFDIDDNGSGTALLCAHAVNDLFCGRGFVCGSRGLGASLYLTIDLSDVPLAERTGTLRRLEAGVLARFPKVDGQPHVEALKGIREPTADNLLYDAEEAAERAVTRPWPADGRTPRPEVAYLYRRDNEYAYRDTRASIYEFYLNHYVGKTFHRCETLEPRTALKIDRHSTVLAPCGHGAGEDGQPRHEQVRRCVDWLERRPLTLADVAHVFSTPPATLRTEAERDERARQRDERHRALMALCDADDRDFWTAEHRGDGAGPRQADRLGRTPRLREMLASGDKLQQSNAVAYLMVRQVGRYDEELVHRLYEQHVAEGRPCDPERRARLRHVGRRAEARYLDYRTGASAVHAADRQRAVAVASRHEWFTEEDIERVTDRLKDLGVTREQLGDATFKCVAVVYLTARKNVWLFEHDAVPERVRAVHRVQAWLLAETGFGARQRAVGVPVPNAAFRGMLKSLHVRNNGSAIHDALAVLGRLGALVCTSRAYSSGAFDEAGRKLDAGYCRRYGLGARDLLPAHGEAAARPVILPLQVVCGPEAEVGRSRAATSMCPADVRGVPRGQSPAQTGAAAGAEEEFWQFLLN